MDAKELGDTMQKWLNATKYLVFILGLIANFAFPIYISKAIDDPQRVVLLCITFFTVIALFIALEQMNMVNKERHDELIAQNKDLIATNGMYSALRKIEESNDDLFYKQARESVTQLEHELREAEQGRLLLDPSHSASFALTLAEQIESSLWATAMWGNDWRGGPLIKSTRNEYLRRLAVAKEKNRKIDMKRLFLIETGIEKDPDFIARVTEDTQNRVEVRYLHVQDWVHTPIAPTAEDFAIWDHSRVWYFTRTPASTHNSNCATICVKNHRVGLYEHAFDANWQAGTPVEHLLGSNPQK